jgi:hypothetical protein
LFFQTGRKGSLYAMIWTDEKIIEKTIYFVDLVI